MIHFISVISAIQIHDELIETYGGAKGIRDYGLLLSALEMPKSSFDGRDLHTTLFDKAAAYLFHVVKNHPFIDGNKRTAAALSLTFLTVNDVRLEFDMADFEEIVVATAESLFSKKEITAFFLSKKRKAPR